MKPILTERELGNGSPWRSKKGWLDDQLLGLDLSLQDQGVVLAAYEALSGQQLPEGEEALREYFTKIAREDPEVFLELLRMLLDEEEDDDGD